MLYDSSGAVAGFKLSTGLCFATGSTWLNQEGKDALRQLFQQLSKDPAVKVSIYGYSDSMGSEEVNLDLTLARAREVRKYLLKLGLASERLVEVKGMGSGDPVADNASEEGRQQNRRVELQIVGMQPARKVLPQAANPESAKPEPAQSPATPVGDPRRFAVGLGYPDLRARLGLGHGWDIEGKFAFGDGIQVYSARLFWNFADLGPLRLTAGGEGGWARFDGLERSSGTVVLGGGFLGLEYPFGKRLRLSIDAGPAWLKASSEGQSYASTELIFNTALYYFFF